MAETGIIDRPQPRPEPQPERPQLPTPDRRFAGTVDTQKRSVMSRRPVPVTRLYICPGEAAAKLRARIKGSGSVGRGGFGTIEPMGDLLGYARASTADQRLDWASTPEDRRLSARACGRTRPRARSLSDQS